MLNAVGLWVRVYVYVIEKGFGYVSEEQIGGAWEASIHTIRYGTVRYDTI